MPGAQLMYILHLILNLYIYTTPWPRIDGLCEEKQELQQGARLLTRSLWLMNNAGDRECGRLLTRSPGLPL